MTISKELTASINEVTGSILEFQKQLQAAHKAAVDDALNNTIALMLNELNLPGLYLYAWTPKFNDGDPCEQSQEIGDAWYCKHDDEWEVVCIDTAELSVEHYEIAKQSCIELTKSEHGMQVAEELLGPLEDALASIFGTDFFLLWMKLDDGTVELVQGKVEPGY